MGKLLDQYAAKLTEELQFDQLPDPAATTPPNPRIVAVVTLLEENPLLAEPTLRFIKGKLAEIASATLTTLYTPDEIEAMKKEAGLT